MIAEFWPLWITHTYLCSWGHNSRQHRVHRLFLESLRSTYICLSHANHRHSHRGYCRGPQPHLDRLHHTGKRGLQEERKQWEERRDNITLTEVSLEVTLDCDHCWISWSWATTDVAQQHTELIGANSIFFIYPKSLFASFYLWLWINSSVFEDGVLSLFLHTQEIALLLCHYLTSIYVISFI